MAPQRTQAERRAATRQALLAAAREVFAERGYADTATEDVVARAGVTRGALYHHFDDKADLFRAVYEDLGREVNERVRRAVDWSDVIDGIRVAIKAFLKECRDPVVQQISFRDAPGVLGMDEWWETEDEHGLALIREGLDRAIEAGLVERRSDRDIELLALMVRAAVVEAGMYVSRTRNVRIKDVEPTLFAFLTQGVLGAPTNR